MSTKFNWGVNKTLSQSPEIKDRLGERKYFLYKLYLESTGQYYIGVTSNIIEREKNHRACIRTLMRYVKMKLKTDVVLPCHLIMAKSLIKGRTIRDLNINTRWIMNDLCFVIISKTKNIERVIKLEDQYLLKTKDDPLCLNINRKSSYRESVFIIKKQVNLHQ